MAWSEDQITVFSKSDKDVVIDNNFGTDDTFSFLDTIFFRLITFAIDSTFSRTDKRFSISDKIIIYII